MKYGTILIDPPWAFKTFNDGGTYDLGPKMDGPCFSGCDVE